MRLHILAVLMVCICFAVANPRIYRRQDNSDAPAITTSSTRTRAGQSSSTASDRPSQSEGSSSKGGDSETLSSFLATGRSSISTSTSTPRPTSAASRTEEVISAITSNANGPVQTNYNRNGNYSFTATPNTLPLEPEITPAFVVGGLLLILTGAAYTLIGVKNIWVHTFFSATYLGAVCVTVLIVYVMSLPVSNSIQGAYLVAIALTGLILGCGAMIFTEMTESLGCLLGGFCFSMWLLVLKPGGLVESQSGRAIIIVVITVAAFGIAFSRYTRQYGLVAGISFSGATAVVLGIDCFSRAGLKEFWAYIWNLNTNLFPVGATSYPVTKGMKVEIAAIIVIFLAGIVSQMELWKMIQDRRQNRRDVELQDDGLTDLEQAEEDVARRIADRILREKKQWEAVYGDKDITPSTPARKDSGIADVDSQRKVTTSIHRSDEDSIEMSSVAFPRLKPGSGLASTNQGGNVIVQVARDNEPSVDMAETGNTFEDRFQQTNDFSIPKPKPDEPKWVGTDGEERSLHISLKRVLVPGRSDSPTIVPLPFRVPKSEVGDEDDGTSMATFADEDRGGHRHSKHLSAGSAILRRLSKRSHRSSRTFSRGGGDSSEDLVIPRAVDNDDDRDSSIAATVDGLSDDEDMRSVRSSIDQKPTTNQVQIIVDAPEVTSPVTTPTINIVANDNEYETGLISEATEAKEILDSEAPLPSPLSRSLTASTEKADISSVASRASITRDQLPSQLSKVVMSYRTNEWAKHLERADNPELDELEHVEYPAETNSKPREVAAPVDLEALQQTAETSSLPTSRSTSQMTNRPPLSRAASKAHPSLYQTRSDSPNGQQYDGNLVRSISQQKLNTSLLRSSVTSSIVDPSVNGDSSKAPNYGLMGKRDSIARAKQSYYANGAALVSMPEFPRASLPNNEAGSVYMYPNHSTPALADDDDNISLSARRSLIRQSSGGQAAALFNSHQPKRQSTAASPIAREQQLASWRASITQDLHSGVVPKNNMERSRSTLFLERQAEEQRRVTEAKVKAKRESLFDERMRRGDMLEAHREALRKMQAKANKAVT